MGDVLRRMWALLLFGLGMVIGAVWLMLVAIPTFVLVGKDAAWQQVERGYALTDYASRIAGS